MFNKETTEKKQSTLIVDERQKNDSVKYLSDILSKSTEETIKTINSKNLLDNVAIFVDYDNVYWTLKKYFNHDPDHQEPEKNLIMRLWERYGQDHVRNFRVYADFQQIRTSLTSLQKKRVQIRHVYSNGKDGENRKNSSDIELCIDAIESTYKDPNISCYVFVTADSDMIPILSRMMYKGKRVELFYLSKAAPKYVELSSYVHYSEDLIDFLSIEEPSYKIEDLLIPALNIIYKWNETYRDSPDLFLGSTWLKRELSNELGVPELIASEIIEKLEGENLTSIERKTVKDGLKNSIVLSEKGLSMLNGYSDIAATKEEK